MGSVIPENLPMKIWGYWTTLGWAVLAFMAGQIVGFAVVLWLNAGAWDTIVQTPYDGVLVTLFIVISNPVMVGVLALAVRLRNASQIDYFALHWPRQNDLVTGIVWLVGLIAVSDALLYASGRDLVTSFQLQSYTSAAAEGWLVPMLFAAIIVAPAGEEFMFRGFLFRGWARSERTAWPAIVVISLLWASLHVQYDWTGMLQIFVIGLFLGWIRLRSGSTLLTFVLHALFNLEGTIETIVQVHYFSK
ncbi:MAG TPA: CPBP family intramembrane glutamic endopeptidase [Xanthobacteraceae bacterium]|nr:CPBP family intramembrane glutamic endopeptidase [Xanthobacteraceae bacterium]